MKKLLQTTMLLVALACIAACSSTPEKTADAASDTAAATIEKVITEKPVAEGQNMNMMANLGINGMTCAMGCAKSIETNIAQMEGVVSCQVDFENKIAHVEFEDTKVSEDDMIQFIQEYHGGQYEVTTVELEKPVVSKEAASEESEVEASNADETALSIKTPTITFPNIFDALMRFYQY